MKNFSLLILDNIKTFLFVCRIIRDKGTKTVMICPTNWLMCWRTTINLFTFGAKKHTHMYNEKRRKKAFFENIGFGSMCVQTLKMERKIMRKYKRQKSEHSRWINFEIRVQKCIITPFRKGIIIYFYRVLGWCAHHF